VQVYVVVDTDACVGWCVQVCVVVCADVGDGWWPGVGACYGLCAQVSVMLGAGVCDVRWTCNMCVKLGAGVLVGRCRCVCWSMLMCDAECSRAMEGARACNAGCWCV
jgi:hypothetical protein